MVNSRFWVGIGWSIERQTPAGSLGLTGTLGMKPPFLRFAAGSSLLDELELELLLDDEDEDETLLLSDTLSESEPGAGGAGVGAGGS